MSLRSVCVLGATGTVGRSTLDVIGRHPDRFRVHALTAHRDVEGMLELCQIFRPEVAVMAQPAAAQQLAESLHRLQCATRVLGGTEPLAAVAADAGSSMVMSAIVGAAGLLPTLAAVRAGKQVLIANKEPLVMAGGLLLKEAEAHDAIVLPVDSEHNAIFQCLPLGYRCGQRPRGVRKLLLTASGGPFRQWSRARLAEATPEEAVRHPNWVMGRKISVDSATLMNKGLELIEAAMLYRMDEAEIEVVIHPQSVIHSMVEFRDGSLLAQMGQPDMRIPIANALAWPQRIDSGVGGLDFAQLAQLQFEAPDVQRFPALALARQALRLGPQATNVLNAANEVAVQAFLDRRMGFMAIAELIADCVEAGLKSADGGSDSLEAILATDRWSRRWCESRLTRAGAH